MIGAVLDSRCPDNRYGAYFAFDQFIQIEGDTREEVVRRAAWHNARNTTSRGAYDDTGERFAWCGPYEVLAECFDDPNNPDDYAVEDRSGEGRQEMDQDCRGSDVMYCRQTSSESRPEPKAKTIFSTGDREWPYAVIFSNSVKYRNHSRWLREQGIVFHQLEEMEAWLLFKTETDATLCYLKFRG